MLRFLIISLLCLAGTLFAYRAYHPVYEYRYALQITLDGPRGKIDGTAMRTGRRTTNPKFLPVHDRFVISERADPLIIDLGDGRLLVSSAVQSRGPEQWLAPVLEPGRRGDHDVSVEKLAVAKGTFPLALTDLPPFLLFADPRNPNSGVAASAENLPALLGPRFRFVSATIEMAPRSPPARTDPRRYFPWIDEACAIRDIDVRSWPRDAAVRDADLAGLIRHDFDRIFQCKTMVAPTFMRSVPGNGDVMHTRIPPDSTLLERFFLR